MRLLSKQTLWEGYSQTGSQSSRLCQEKGERQLEGHLDEQAIECSLLINRGFQGPRYSTGITVSGDSTHITPAVFVADLST